MDELSQRGRSVSHTSAAPASRAVVIVAGMHRSGTSALTYALSALGAKLPLRLMSAHESNPLGHFEPAAMVELHDQLLSALGSSWSDWRSLPAGWLSSPECGRIRTELARAFREDFADAPLAVIKDPRICRLVPLWEQVLDELGYTGYYAIPYRNPIEVARSLANRNGFDSYESQIMWLRSILDAELNTRGAARVFLRYEQLVDNPQETLDRLVASFPVMWDAGDDASIAKIKEQITGQHRHHHAGEADLLDRRLVPSWVDEAYRMCRLLEEDPDDPAACSALDAIAAGFADAERFIGEQATSAPGAAADRPGGADNRIRGLQLLNFRLRQVRADVSSQPSLLGVPKGGEDGCGETKRDLLQKSGRIGYLYATLAQHADALDRTNKALAQYVAETNDLRVQKEDLQAGLAAALQDKNDLETKLAAALQDKNDLEAKLATALQAASEAKAETETVRREFLNSRSWRWTAVFRRLRLG